MLMMGGGGKACIPHIYCIHSCFNTRKWYSTILACVFGLIFMQYNHHMDLLRGDLCNTAIHRTDVDLSAYSRNVAVTVGKSLTGPTWKC